VSGVFCAKLWGNQRDGFFERTSAANFSLAVAVGATWTGGYPLENESERVRAIATALEAMLGTSMY
jgi:hypothetical protein